MCSRWWCLCSATAEQVEVVRGAILDHFHAPHQDWALVFTSGATDSLKLLAESFPWGRERSRLFYALNSHTSVLGEQQQGPVMAPLVS